MSKDRLTAVEFADNLLVAHQELRGNGYDSIVKLAKMVDERDRETRNMACSELISAAEDLIVAPVAPESTETDDYGVEWAETPVEDKSAFKQA